MMRTRVAPVTEAAVEEVPVTTQMSPVVSMSLVEQLVAAARAGGAAIDGMGLLDGNSREARFNKPGHR